MDNINFEKLQNVLEEFSKIDKGNPQKENFFSICGFPHYEVVASKVLSFFMDTTREHGFKDMLVKSLMEAVNSRPEHKDFFDKDALNISDFTSETEVATLSTSAKNVKFIDILLQSENLNIAIENKIQADLYNNLDEYHKRAAIKDCSPETNESNENESDNEVNAKVVVLSLNEIDNEKKEKFTKEDKKKDYAFITYINLFVKIRENIGDYIQHADTRYTQFLMEFMNNIENLKEPVKMNYDFVEFLNKDKNAENVFQLKRALKELEDCQRKKVERVIEILKVELDKEENTKIKEKSTIGKWRSKEAELYNSFFDVVNAECTCENGLVIAVEAFITLEGWCFHIVPRPKKSNGNDATDYIEEQLLQKFEYNEEHTRLILKDKIELSVKEEEVAKHIFDLVEKLIG